MLSEFKSIKELFQEIEKAVKTKISLYMIGGAVLLYHGLKPSTKDIDIIVKTKEEFLSIQNALIKAGFNKERTGGEYAKMNLIYVFTRGDFRIDLFLEKVCSKFLLSEAMMKRSVEILNLNKISLYLCSHEDIFLFKTMTNRQGDLEDCISIARKGVNWETIKQELLSQIKISGRDIWITWTGERLDLLEDRGLNIPIMKDINRLRENYFDSLDVGDKNKSNSKQKGREEGKWQK